VATLCTNCGKELAQGSARFCSNCGAAVLADSSQSRLEHSKVVLREQVAEQPFSPPVRANASPPSVSTASPAALPRTTIRLQSISLERVEISDPASVAAQESIAVPSSPPSHPVRQTVIPSRPKASRATVHVVVPVETQRREEVLDTPPTPTQEPVVAPSSPPSEHREEVEVSDPVPAQEAIAMPSSPASHLVRQPVLSRPEMPQTIARIVMPSETDHGWKRRRVLPLLVCCLLVVGVVAWDILFQPFSVPAVTHPQQKFSDSHLGISLLYPNGWKALLDQRTSTVRLSDSTNTAQITISVINATDKEIGQYLEQQAKQLGMTAIKSGTVSFGGASWQQLQGGVQQSGATYTVTLLATIHGKQLFTVIQAAPQNTYQDEERLVFAPMRRSFSFST